MKAGFTKRVSSPRLFFHDLSFILTRIPRYLEIAWAKRVSLAFSEKIRLATTAVNQCVICARVHYEWAQLAGVDRNEIRALLNNDLKGGGVADDNELVALLYAQHYAESNQNPDPDKTRQLHEYYGPATATDITLIIRLISFFNLTGNTLEAFLSRIAGRKPRQSNLLFEILMENSLLPP